MLGLADLGGIVTNSISLIIVSAATTLFGIWVLSWQKPRKDFPPGPKGWPLLGNILDFRGDIPAPVIFMEHAKKFGDIFSIRIGQRWTVVINGAAVIKEVLLKRGVEFANRPTAYSTDVLFGGGKNIAFSQFTPRWKLHRKLAYSAFRTLATGNNERFEKLVYSILPGLTKHLESNGSKPFNPFPILASSIYSIMSTMCFGKQFPINGPDVTFWMKVNEETIKIMGNGLAADYIPIMKYIPTPAAKKCKNIVNDFHDWIRKEIQEHRAEYDRGEPKDLVEMIFQARQELEDEGKEDMSMLTEDHIRYTIADVFLAGTETSSRTLHWSIGLLIQHPDVQAKVAAEVDRVVGRRRLPSLDDRDNLPYTTATLYEVMRYSSLVPMALPHATTDEVKIGGYTLPEGTNVLLNLYSMHYDEKLWDDPQKFKPEHFLDKTGEVRLHPEGFMPFSTGRRVCLGESVAKAELFLVFSWFFQHFKFTKAPGMEDKDYSEGVCSTFNSILKENDVVVEKRF